MAIQYAGGTNVSVSWTQTTGTRGELVTKLETELGNAGWTTISGGGTGDVLMESATTPQGLKVRVRLYDAGSGNCAQVMLKNASGSLTTQAHYLLPAVGKTWRIIANKYQAFCWVPGATAAREYVGFGVLWIPAFLEGVVTDLSAWIHGNANGDTDTTVRETFRTVMYATNGRRSQIVDSYKLDMSGGLQNADQRLWLESPCLLDVNNNAWQDGSRPLSDPGLGFGITATTELAMLRGLLWDAMIMAGQRPGDSTYTHDGKTWRAVTNNCGTGTNLIGGTLLVVG